MKDRPFQLTDLVREASYAIHRYHGCGHLEKVYENALVHRLRKLGLKVEQQKALTVYDEDGTVIGEYFADLLIEDQLIVEVKAAKAIADEHLAQVLGYLRSAKMEHGVLVNFGSAKFQIRKLGDVRGPAPASGGIAKWVRNGRKKRKTTKEGDSRLFAWL